MALKRAQKLVSMDGGTWTFLKCHAGYFRNYYERMKNTSLSNLAALIKLFLNLRRAGRVHEYKKKIDKNFEPIGQDGRLFGGLRLPFP